MIRRSFRFGLLLGLLGGAAFALTKLLGTRAPQHLAPAPWPRLADDPTVAAAPIARPIPDPAAPVPPAATEEAVVAAAPPRAVPDPVRAEPPVVKPPVVEAPAKKAPAKKAKVPAKAWVEPKGGVCPTTHRVKAKLSSKIFHLPGMLNYERTNPDRCYVDAEKAEADGLRAAKR